MESTCLTNASSRHSSFRWIGIDKYVLVMVNRSPVAVVTNLIMNPFYQFYHRHDIDISGVIPLMFAIMLV